MLVTETLPCPLEYPAGPTPRMDRDQSGWVAGSNLVLDYYSGTSIVDE